VDIQSRKRPCVLIVDDRKNWLDTLCDLLDSDAYDIETATSYDEAMCKLEQRAFHVLVADQRLADADEKNIEGILLLDELDKLQDGTQAIIVTGYPTKEAIKRALRGSRAHDYILKHPEEGGPFNIRGYREVVREATDVAIGERELIVAKDAQKLALLLGLTYGQIAEALFNTNAVAPVTRERVEEVLGQLFHPLLPLAYGIGRARPSEFAQSFEILGWSRGLGQAVLVGVSTERGLGRLEARQAVQLGELWYPIRKRDNHVSAPVAGISFVVDDLTFGDFSSIADG